MFSFVLPVCACMSVFVHACMCMCVSFIHACMHVCVHVYVHVCMCVYVDTRACTCVCLAGRCHRTICKTWFSPCTNWWPHLSMFSHLANPSHWPKLLREKSAKRTSEELMLQLQICLFCLLTQSEYGVNFLTFLSVSNSWYSAKHCKIQ